MISTQVQVVRWVRRGVLVAVALLLWWGLRDLRFVVVAQDDWSTPGMGPGRKALVRAVAGPEDLEVGELYFAAYRWPPEAESLELRLVRLIGAPGERVEVEGEEVRVGGRRISVPSYCGRLWPALLASDQCLVLTDEPFVAPPRRLHPDSRELGSIAVEGLHYRVAGVLPF